MLSYPNFVRGPLLDDMRPFFGPCEVLASIIRQFVKFQDMPKNQKNIDAQSVSFRDTPEIKWKHRCIIK